MEKTLVRYVTLFISFFVIFSANAQEKIKTDTHTWYYFSKNSLVEITSPQDAPLSLFKPWTEAVRVSSSNITSNTGFLLVNRLGLLVCDPNTKLSEKNIPTLYPDITFFSETTANSLISYNGYPTFHLYKNILFNELLNISQSTFLEEATNSPILVQFHPESGIFYPLLFTRNITSDKNALVTGLFFDGEKWACTVKSIIDDRTIQNYLSFSTTEPISIESQSSIINKISIRELTTDEYRTTTTPKDYSTAPKRLTTLLSSIPETFPFYITCSLPDNSEPLQYVRQNDTGESMAANALLDEIFSIAIFADGTTYFSGSLPNRYVLNGGALVAFRLPKLSEGFSYGSFTVAGSMLYISWEETDFYKTGRSGILSVNLDKVLY